MDQSGDEDGGGNSESEDEVGDSDDQEEVDTEEGQEERGSDDESESDDSSQEGAFSKIGNRGLGGDSDEDSGSQVDDYGEEDSAQKSQPEGAGQASLDAPASSSGGGRVPR